MSKKELFRIPVTIVNAKNQAESICMTEAEQQMEQRVMSALRQKLEELRQEAIDNGMQLRSEDELRMEENVLEAPKSLNKPAGLPEMMYCSDDVEKWLEGIVERTVRKLLEEFFGYDKEFADEK